MSSVLSDCYIPVGGGGRSAWIRGRRGEGRREEGRRGEIGGGEVMGRDKECTVVCVCACFKKRGKCTMWKPLIKNLFFLFI